MPDKNIEQQTHKKEPAHNGDYLSAHGHLLDPRFTNYLPFLTAKTAFMFSRQIDT